MRGNADDADSLDNRGLVVATDVVAILLPLIHGCIFFVIQQTSSEAFMFCFHPCIGVHSFVATDVSAGADTRIFFSAVVTPDKFNGCKIYPSDRWEAAGRDR